MIIITKIRKCPTTGLGKHKRKAQALIYLRKTFGFEQVAVIPLREYKADQYNLKAYRRKLIAITKIIKKG